MTRAQLHQPHRPGNDVPAELAPGALPVEPNQRPVPGLTPDDPERKRDSDPGMTQITAPRSATATAAAAATALPHERDQSTNTTADAPDPVIAQAKRDLDAGLVDTDMHATAGLDARLRARLVPGAGGKPPPLGG